MQVPLTDRHRPDRADQVVVDGGLEDIAAGPRLEGPADVVGLTVHRQDDHGHVRVQLMEPARAFEAADPRHLDVHQHEGGTEALHRADGVLGGAGLAGDLQAVLALDDEPQTAPDDSMVVDDHHANGLTHLEPPVRR